MNCSFKYPSFLLLIRLSIFLYPSFLRSSSPLTYLSIISAPPPSDPVPWPTRVGQLQLWPTVRRLRQRLRVTPTGSQRCLAVVLACEWGVQSARRGGEPLTPWLLPELALSRAEVNGEVLSSPLPPHTSRSPLQIAAIRADDTIIAPFCVFSPSKIYVKLLSSSKGF